MSPVKGASTYIVVPLWLPGFYGSRFPGLPPHPLIPHAHATRSGAHAASDLPMVSRRQQQTAAVSAPNLT